MPALKIVNESRNGLELVIVRGEIDMDVAPQLRKSLLNVGGEGTAGVVVDLSGVPYMDSSGIATLIEGVQQARKAGRRFFLIGAQVPVHATLKLARLEQFFEIYPDLGALLAGTGGHSE